MNDEHCLFDDLVVKSFFFRPYTTIAATLEWFQSHHFMFTLALVFNCKRELKIYIYGKEKEKNKKLQNQKN